MVLVNFDELLDKALQFFFHEFLEKVVNFLSLICTRFIDFLLNFILRFSRFKKKKEIETFTVLLQGNFLIINKKHDVLLNSNDKSKNTVTSQLKLQFPDILSPEIADFFFAHRLDFATSGILCIPLNRKACQEVWENFETKYTKFYFIAIVSGHVDSEMEVIDIDIGDDTRYKDTSKKMCSFREKMFCKNARRSVTKILVLERGYFNDRPVTKVLLLPLTTNRRHQLRIHCLEIGHAIVGDYTYGKCLSSPRLFLHAFRLVLPTSIENIDIQTEDVFTERKLKYKYKRGMIFNEIPSAFDLIDSF